MIRSSLYDTGEEHSHICCISQSTSVKICFKTDSWFWCHFVPNLLECKCARQYSFRYIERLDKVIANKIKRCSYLPRSVVSKMTDCSRSLWSSRWTSSVFSAKIWRKFIIWERQDETHIFVAVVFLIMIFYCVLWQMELPIRRLHSSTHVELISSITDPHENTDLSTPTSCSSKSTRVRHMIIEIYTQNLNNTWEIELEF